MGNWYEVAWRLVVKQFLGWLSKKRRCGHSKLGATLKAHKVTLKEKATEALCSLMARLGLEEDNADNKA